MNGKKRPTMITIVGWTWILLGILSLLTAIQEFLGTMGSIFFLAREMLGPFADEIRIVIPMIRSAVAAVAVVSGIQALSMNASARRNLELLSWLAFIPLGLQIAAQFIVAGSSWITIIPWGAYIAIALIPGSIYVFSIVALRSKEVRGTFEDAGTEVDRG